MSKVFTNMDRFHKDCFPKNYKKERLEKMSIKERVEHEVSQMMKRILKEGK